MYYERSCLPPLPSPFLKKKKRNRKTITVRILTWFRSMLSPISARSRSLRCLFDSDAEATPPDPTLLPTRFWKSMLIYYTTPATILYVYVCVCVTVTKTTTARPWLCVHSSDSLELKHATTNNLSAPSCSEHALLEIYSYEISSDSTEIVSAMSVFDDYHVYMPHNWGSPAREIPRVLAEAIALILKSNKQRPLFRKIKIDSPWNGLKIKQDFYA